LINSKEQRNLDVPQVEKDSIESAKLEYFQVCNMQLPTSTTALKIYLNNNPMPISSTRIKCNSMKNSFDIDADLLRAGQNTLSFVLEEAGDFSLNEVALITESKETDFPSYVFSLSSNQYKDIKSGAKTIELTMDLGAKKVAKSARLSVNSGDIFMNTKDSSFTYNLRDYVEEGSNHLRIIPTNDFTMNSLKVVLK
jgi:hypothetical protein